MNLLWWRKAAGIKPNPLWELCRCLVEKPWEWSAAKVTRNNRAIVHAPSGVMIQWSLGQGNCWIAQKGEQYVAVSDTWRDSILDAIVRSAANRVAIRPRPFGDSAVALAKAVLAGHHEAARALADEVFEHAN